MYTKTQNTKATKIPKYKNKNYIQRKQKYKNKNTENKKLQNTQNTK